MKEIRNSLKKYEKKKNILNRIKYERALKKEKKHKKIKEKRIKIRKLKNSKIQKARQEPIQRIPRKDDPVTPSHSLRLQVMAIISVHRLRKHFIFRL